MKRIILSAIMILISFIVLSQSPNSFKYQTIVRDASGYAMANQNVSFQISILQGSVTGISVYTETFDGITTNEFGLVNINIGEGTTSDIFSNIDWANGPYFLKIELDETGGTSYVEMGTSQLLSVPYAMYAKDVENKDDADADATNELINSATLSGTNLEINDAGGTTIIDLSSLDQSGMSVDDADADPLNELQTLSLSTNTLSLTNGGSVSLGQYSNLWQQNDTNIYYNSGWVGVGTSTPTGMMVVQGDAGVDPDSALFEVKNKNGQTIFAVYDGGVRIYVDDTGVKASTDKGGFAVAGYRIDKAVSNEYLRVTPDSVRMYFDNQSTSGVGHAGGFAIQSFNGLTKAGNTGIMYLEESNYFIGENSGINISTGTYNSTFGFNAGSMMSTASRNVFLGFMAGSQTTEGNDNVFIGNEAGITNTKGWNNVVIGSYAGNMLDSAWNNVIIGKQAGQHLSSGLANIFIGTQAGNSTTTAVGNIFIGDDAGLANDTGYNNIFMGSGSGSSNTYGANNIFLGTESGVSNTTGSNNNFIGFQAGASNTTGEGNNFIGYQSGNGNQTGNENCYLGFQTGFNAFAGSRNVLIGYHAAFSSIGNSQFVDNIIIGDSTGLINNSYSNIFIGNNAGQNNTQYENVYIGNNCAKNGFAGQYNTYIGTDAGIDATGSLNTLYGNGCGKVLSGDYNAFYGLGAGDIIESSFNTIIGTMAGGANVTGGYNTVLGYDAGMDGDFDNSIAIGYLASVGASDEAVIGNPWMTSIGGYTAWTNLSDKRFKTNVQENVVGLDFIMKLQPVTYNIDMDKLNSFSGVESKEKLNNKENITYTGFLAQDVEKVAKELGYDFSGVDAPQNEKDHYGLRYSTFVVPLVKAVQEQQSIIDAQKTELELLKEKLDELSKEVKQLQSK